MPARVVNHLRSNLISYAALFLALGGTAWASGTVGSADVIDNSLRSVDLRDGAAVASQDVVDDSLTGTAINESTLGKVPNADKLDGVSSSGILKKTDSAGGDFSGPLSNLQLRSGSVDGNEMQNNALTRSDLSTSAAGGFGLVDRDGSLSRSSNVIKVTHPKGGTYCITPSSGINPNGREVVTTPDYSHDDTTNGANGTTSDATVMAEWDSTRLGGCPDGTFEVDTFVQKTRPENANYWGEYVANEGFAFEIR